MKSTIKVSISGVAFNLEDDAYQLLKSYLDKLAAHFNKNEEGKEIIEDIEARLAELLLARINTPEQVVTGKDTSEVIAILGKPEELNDNDTASGSTGNSDILSTPTSAKRRLYRNPDNQIIAGVCGGLGVYFNVDPVILRVLLVVLIITGLFLEALNLSAIAIISYAILWISLPKALTMVQKMEMRGESPTVANIERKIREETIANAPKRNVFGKLIRAGFYIFAAIIAIPIICVGITLIVAFIAVSFAGGWVLHDSIFPLLDFVSMTGTSLSLIKILAVFVITVPILLLVYAGIRLLFRFKAKSKGITLGLTTIWVLSLFGLAGIGAFVFKSYRSGVKLTDREALQTTSDTLYVNIPQQFDQNNSRFYVGWSSDNRHPHIPYLWINEQEDTISVFPNVEVVYVDDSTFNISYTRFTRAKSKNLAQKKADELSIPYHTADSLLIVTPYQFTKDSKWSGEWGKLVIYAPKNKKVILDNELQWDGDIFD